MQLTLKTLIPWFLQDCEARNLSPKTVLFYHERLSLFLRLYGDCAVTDITTLDLKRWLQETRAARQWAVTTTNHSIRTLRVFWKFLVAEELVSQNPTLKLVKLKEAQRLPEPFTDDEIHRLLGAAGTGLRGARDQAIILVLLDCGLRLQELLNLRCADVDMLALRLHVQQGKGRKDRVTPFSAPVRRALLKYLAFRDTLKPQHDALWIASDGLPYHRESLKSQIERWGKKAGVLHCHAHRFRHSFAFRFIANGGSPAYLQNLLGHSTGDMTQRYMHLVNLDATEEHKRVSPAANLLGHRWRGA